jgi:hypothetical protein
VADPAWDSQACNWLDDPYYLARPWLIPVGFRAGLKLDVVRALYRQAIESDPDWREVFQPGGTMPPAEGARERRVEGRLLPMARPRFQKGYLRLRSENYELRYRDDVFDADGRVHRVYRSVVLGAFGKKKQAQRAAEKTLNSKPGWSVAYGGCQV